MALQAVADSKPLQPLTRSERAAVFVFTDEQSSLADVARSIEYVRTDSAVKIRLSKEVLAGAAIGGAFGGLGSISALILNIFSTPSPLAFVAKAMALGAGIGGVLGFASGIKTHVIEVKKTNEYEEWRLRAIRDRVLPIFLEFLEAEPELRKCLCPSSHELMRIPVRGPDGVVWEQEEAIRWITQKTKVLAYRYLKITEDQFNAASQEQRKKILEDTLKAIPVEEIRDGERITKEQVLREFSIRNLCYVKVEDLQYYPEYHRKVFEKIREVFNREVDLQIKEGLTAYATDVLKTKRQIAKHLLSQHFDAFMDGRISKRAFDAKIEEMERLLALESI